MDILIVSKKMNKANVIEESAKNIGQYYSTDRYYTLLNNFIDKNLKNDAKLVYFFINFFMRSSNFKHDTSISNGKSIWVWLVDIFCWICLAIFIGCFLSGIAKPIVDAVKNGNFLDAFKSSTAIGLLITAFFTFVISSIYLYMLKKVIAVNKKLNLIDYVNKKIDYVLKLSPLIKTNTAFFKTKEEGIILIEKLEGQTDINKWLTLQINNLMYRLFTKFNMVLKFSNIEEKDVQNIERIIENDFKNSEVVRLVENPENINENDCDQKMFKDDLNILEMSQEKLLSMTKKLKPKKSKKKTNNKKTK